MRNLKSSISGLFFTAFVVLYPIPHITGMLGVSRHTATKIIDAILAGASIWTILAMCIAGASFMAIIMATAKSFAKQYGTAVAIAW